VRLLIDTNIFLEIMLSQERSDESRSLLTSASSQNVFITDYTLHSIGLILFRRQRHLVFQQFVDDIVIRAGYKVIALGAGDMSKVVEVSQKFNIDFDDAYQYAVMEQHNLMLVSFDTDFNRTARWCYTPREILKKLNDLENTRSES
jgi:uncharacterized protein